MTPTEAIARHLEAIHNDRPIVPESCAPWGDFTLMLLTPEELAKVPNGQILIDIFGQPEVKTETMDTDTRGGYTAYGYLKSKD